MKKINAMMMFAVVTAALVSCNKEKDLASDQNGEGIRISVTASMPETRTVLADGGKNVNWTSTDKVGFINGADNVNVESSPAELDGEGRATFTGTVPTKGTYYAYYPYFNDAEYAPNDKGVTVRVPNTQHPTLESFDPAADLLVSEAFYVSAASSYSTDPTTLRFRRLGAFIKVRFVDNTSKGKLTDKYAASVSIQGDNNLVGRFRISGTEGLVNQDSGFKKVTAEYAAEPFRVTSSNAWFGVAPQTFVRGSTLTVTVNVDGADIIKALTIPKDVVLGAGSILPIKVTFTDGDFPTELEKVLTLERVWGFYKEGTTPWYDTSNITAVSIAHPDRYGMARGLAMDDEFIYLPKASGYANVAAVSIADKTVQKALNKSGVAGGSTFATSFVRMIKNTDASVNGGKDILLLCNLTSTDSDANQLKLYAYKDGVDAAPTKIAAFCWDSANNVNDWRRYGDRFFVEGDWSNAKVYFPSFAANKSVVLSIANGARTAVTQIAAGAANSPEGIKDLTVYPGDNKLFLTNNSIANLVAPTGGKANGWDEYSLSASSSEAVGTWGYNFFEFNGKKYIAYARIIGGTKAQIEIIEDKGDLLTSLSAKEGLMVSPIHDATDLDKEVATGNLADCCVRVIGEEVYIAALTRDGGFVLDKLYLK